MKNKNIQFIVLLVLFVVVLDFFTGKIYELCYFSETSKNNSRLIHSVLKTNEDVLIFGSSRAIHHYNPKIIEDSLKLTCYNVGLDGQNIYYHLALLKSALQRNTPKIVVLELLTIDFEQTRSTWDTEKLNVLLPFVSKSKSSMDAVLLRGNSEYIKLQSSVYPFNSQQYMMLRNNFYPLNNSYNGFMPIDKVLTGSLKVKPITKNPVDVDKMSALHQFIKICKERNIKLFIFVSPSYISKKGLSEYSHVTAELQDNYKLNVYSFESDTLFLKHPEYFADSGHLNNIGADIYTSLIIEIVQREMQEK